MHSVRIELTKLILVGTRITYQATRDAYKGISVDTVASRTRFAGLYIYHQ